ncbi:sigma factor-like helix-turn-helix DNA-binding protein [Aquabacter cavernae]|uniref:sigma factor-like helix-turn-helix DNA-binding protein n=1 Tax=Aquabacter cavernae TaxID=2496029 RepID=UPI000F8F5A0B|nr:sigma factor-like helix-turn-helix DNA-binding protein [Aquabacter cavernae]
MSNSDGLKDLLSGVAQADRTAFRRLYGLTAPRLLGITLRILRDRPQAIAAVEAAYVKIWGTAADLAEEEDVLGALASLARSEAIDRVREMGSPAHALDPFEIDATAEDPLAGMARSEDLQHLLGCLGQLSEERRRLVLHAYYDGWSREALSVYFDAPPHAVNTWIWRSITELDACVDS